MTTLTDVIFLSQQAAEEYSPGSSEAIISITDKGAPEANLRAGWFAVLRLSFDDVDPIESPVEPGEDLVEMQDHHADRIADFVASNRHVLGTLVVHCRYGQSRSAAVAKAVASYYGLWFPEDYEYANNHVFELVLKSLRQQGEA